MRKIRAWCDGAYRKGYMGFGFHVRENNGELHSESSFRMPAEHNSAPRAEALALYAALDWLKKANLTNEIISVFSDSELCIKQMNGEYKINPDTSHAEVISAVRNLATEFRSIKFKWIPRESNERADYLSGFVLEKLGIHKT